MGFAPFVALSPKEKVFEIDKFYSGIDIFT